MSREPSTAFGLAFLAADELLELAEELDHARQVDEELAALGHIEDFDLCEGCEYEVPADGPCSPCLGYQKRDDGPADLSNTSAELIDDAGNAREVPL